MARKYRVKGNRDIIKRVAKDYGKSEEYVDIIMSNFFKGILQVVKEGKVFMYRHVFFFSRYNKRRNARKK